VSKERTSLLEFPCVFPVKAIGKDKDGFQQVVVEIIRRHVPELDEGAVTTRASAGGKYISVTATFVAQSREQLDAMYSELSRHDQVLYVL
jgi:putative lipoic acid-binding regulatory protein